MLASVAAISCGGDNPKSLVFAVQPNVLSTDMTATLTIFFTPPGKDAKPPTDVAAANVSGAGYQAITGFLFTFGGFISAGTIANTNAAALCPSNGCATGTAPTLTNWNNGGGGTPLAPRALLASIIEEPFIYILGGTTATGTTASTERTVW